MSPSRGSVSPSASPIKRRSARSFSTVTMSGRPAARDHRNQTAPDRRPECDIAEAMPGRPMVTRRTGCSSTLDHSSRSTSRSHLHVERDIPRDASASPPHARLGVAPATSRPEGRVARSCTIQRSRRIEEPLARTGHLTMRLPRPKTSLAPRQWLAAM
jgi:hypothetical protein